MMLFIHHILIYQKIEKEKNHAMDGYFIYQLMIHYVELPAIFLGRKSKKNKSPNDTISPQMPERNKTVNLSLCDLLTSRK